MDWSYHWEYSKPAFDTVEDQVRYQRIKEAEYILEPRVPDLPDRQTELDYMEWLKNDLRSDPWVAFRKQKLAASPKRVPFANRTRLLNH